MPDISTDDIIINIITYLPVQDLLRAIEISKQWFSAYLKDSKRIWEMHSNQLWLESKMIVNIPHYDTTLLSRIKKVPLSVMKFNLQRVDISRCIEKIDYQKMLLAYILFGGRYAIDSTKLRIYYPQWALEIEDHKATYFFSKRDSKRTQIFMSELCMIDWVFHFKNDYGYEEEGSSTAISKFRADYSYFSARFGQTYSWQVRLSVITPLHFCLH